MAWLVIFPAVFGFSFGLAYWASNQFLPSEQVVRQTPAVSLAQAANDMMRLIGQHNQLCHPSALAQLSDGDLARQLDDADQLFGEARGHFSLMELAASQLDLGDVGYDLVLNQLLHAVERNLASYGQVTVAQAALVERQLNPSETTKRLAPSVYLSAIYDGFQQRRDALGGVQAAYDNLMDWLAAPCHEKPDCKVAMALPSLQTPTVPAE